MRPFPAAAAACLFLAPLPGGADELGRLFFTPEQRAALERQRLLAAPGAPTGKNATSSGYGVVLRSGGGTTTWRDGVSRYEAVAAGAKRRETIHGNARGPAIPAATGTGIDRRDGLP